MLLTQNHQVESVLAQQWDCYSRYYNKHWGREPFFTTGVESTKNISSNCRGFEGARSKTQVWIVTMSWIKMVCLHLLYKILKSHCLLLFPAPRDSFPCHCLASNSTGCDDCWNSLHIEQEIKNCVWPLEVLRFINIHYRCFRQYYNCQ